MIAALVTYVLGVFVVAAALHHELEAKPKAVAATVLLYPLIPAALVVLVTRLIV